MKTLSHIFILLSFVLSSCETKAQSGALIGAGAGATTGALISHSAGGALIGGAVGAIGGGLIGYAMDEHDRAVMAENSPYTLHKIDRRQQLSLNDIKEMSKNGINDHVIINEIKSTNSVFYLTTADIIDLKDAGVSQRVIDFMIQTGE